VNNNYHITFPFFIHHTINHNIVVEFTTESRQPTYVGNKRRQPPTDSIANHPPPPKEKILIDNQARAASDSTNAELDDVKERNN
jgi:hypothetical protein